MLRIDINNFKSSGFEIEFPIGPIKLNDRFRFIQCSQEEYAIDLKIYGIMRGYIKMIGDYIMEKPKLKAYSIISLEEYDQLLESYTSDYIPDIDELFSSKEKYCGYN